MDVHLSVHEPEGYRLVSNQGLVMALGIGYALLMVSEEERKRSKRERENSVHELWKLTFC